MILNVRSVSKKYREKAALENVSLQLEGGSVFGLLGPNGAGKTTLIRAITGITQIDKGEILLNGTPIGEKERRHIGYLPEERGLYPDMKVGEQLLYLARLKGMAKEDATASIKGWMRKFQISGTIGKRTNELSKGMQQKVQFIAAVVHSPQLLILDEPFSGFDPINTQLVKQEILALKNSGVGIILSTHNMTSVEEICDSVALIDRSHIILEGKTTEIRKSHKKGQFFVEIEANVPFNNGESLHSQFRRREDGLWIVEKKENAEIDNNTLIREVSEFLPIASFREAQPSMNEIFLNTINNR